MSKKIIDWDYIREYLAKFPAGTFFFLSDGRKLMKIYSHYKESQTFLDLNGIGLTQHFSFFFDPKSFDPKKILTAKFDEIQFTIF